MTLVAGWNLQKLEASFKLTISDMKEMWENQFRQAKIFYFSSQLLPGSTSKVSDGTGKEWRLTVSLGNTAYFHVAIARHASSSVKITEGSLAITGTDLTSETSCGANLVGGIFNMNKPGQGNTMRLAGRNPRYRRFRQDANGNTDRPSYRDARTHLKTPCLHKL